MATFGSLVEQQMHNAAEGKSGKKAQMAVNLVLQNWLGPAQDGKTGFRDPGAMASRRRR